MTLCYSEIHELSTHGSKNSSSTIQWEYDLPIFSDSAQQDHKLGFHNSAPWNSISHGIIGFLKADNFGLHALGRYGPLLLSDLSLEVATRP